MLSALWIEGLLFSANGGGHALAEVPRLVQQVIKVPQSFAEYRRLDRIHGDRERRCNRYSRTRRGECEIELYRDRFDAASHPAGVFR
jgi:hypothetical protein